MSGSDPMAVTVTPIFLRLALAVTFLWAGSTKIFWTMPLQGEPVAVLAQMGVPLTPARAAPAAAPVPAPSTPAPSVPLPPPDAKPTKAPAGKGAAAPTTQPGAARPVASATVATLPVLAQMSPNGAAGATFSAEQFSSPVEVRRLYGLALLVRGAANPPAREGGGAAMPLWPPRLATGSWPVVFAWGAAITELVGGALVLVGLFTRFWAFLLAGTMAAAMWLTEIGPAVQAGKAVLGFLPPYAATDVDRWSSPLWQFSLLMIGLAVVFSGAGALSVDRSVLGPAGGGGGGAKK